MASSILSFLAQGMNLSHQAADVITNNLANYETPNFKPQTLSFQQALAAAWQNGTPVSTVTGTVQTDPGAVRPDGSGVSMTGQMASLMQMQMLYDTAATGFTSQATQIRAVAEGQAL